jgi:GNAT superfamily N-acetyltransferase
VEQARAATAADIPVLTTLWELAVAELDGQRGGALLAGTLVTPEPLAVALEQALAIQDRLLVLGSTEEVDVGFAFVRCDRARREPVGVIEAVYVEPSARLIGVGEAILELVVSWCAERGCRGVDAPALPGSRPAKAFFEDHGFVARLLVMHHPLPPSPGSAHG